MQRLTKSVLLAVVGLAWLAPLSPSSVRADDSPPRIFLDKPKVAAYQLKKLDNARLVQVERKTDDPKYALVFETMLVRKGLERKFRQEAASGLAALNKTDVVVEILNGIGKTEPDDDATRADLVGVLLTQKPATLAAQKAKIGTLAAESKNASLREAAYAALVVADGTPDSVWKDASAKPGGLSALLGAVSMLPDAKLRMAFASNVKPLVEKAPDDATRAAAIDALGFIPGHEAESFATLSSIVQKESGDLRAAAVRSIRHISADKWPAEQRAPLATSIVKLVGQTPTGQRATPAVVEMIQLGEELASGLPADQGRPLRKSLRELGVRTILVRTLKEQMAYDLRYFVVQAGKPVQIVLDNADGMPHNLVVTAPGAVEDVGTAGGLLPPPTDPAAKAFIPNSPKVLHSSHLVQPGKSETISFEAPKDTGEYGYVCTFPGHWVRMYGVMLVVPDLDEYDAKPIVPTDPLTKKPFESQKHDAGEAPVEHAH